MRPDGLLAPEDLPELDDLLDVVDGDRKMSDKELRQWNANVHSRIEDDLDSLLAEATRPRPTWTTEAGVVLIHEQQCISCGFVTQTSQGWFTAQKHTTDTFAHRLLAGKPPGKLPLRVERHKLADVEICANCAEGQVAIESAVGGPYGGH